MLDNLYRHAGISQTPQMRNIFTTDHVAIGKDGPTLKVH
jgi:transketolase